MNDGVGVVLTTNKTLAGWYGGVVPREVFIVKICVHDLVSANHMGLGKRKLEPLDDLVEVGTMNTIGWNEAKIYVWV